MNGDKANFELQIVFTIFDYALLPEQISAALVLQPEEAMQRGQRNPQLGLPRSSFWSLRSNASDASADLSEHWSSIDHLAEKVDIIRSISGQGFVRLTIIADGTGRIPSIVIPVSLSTFASRLNAEIDIDIFNKNTY